METMRKIRIQSLAAGLAVGAMMASTVAVAQADCPNCGVVTSVKAYSHKPKHSTVGMIGGGVVGALAGNAIGNGSTLATVGGAAGGAYLGNKVGQKVQAKTSYKVVVRMDHGGTRTVTYASRPAVVAGSHVRVENGRLIQTG